MRYNFRYKNRGIKYQKKLGNIAQQKKQKL